MKTATTKHARVRMQQRAIPSFVVDLLQSCGTSFRSYGGEQIIFDKQARRRLRHYLGGDRGLRALEPWLDTYIVLADSGDIITVARRQSRIRRR